jgi:hypothetical protein
MQNKKRIKKNHKKEIATNNSQQLQLIGIQSPRNRSQNKTKKQEMIQQIPQIPTTNRNRIKKKNKN